MQSSFKIDARDAFFLSGAVMKGLLGCLMCLVFTASQTFAISGGPFGSAKLSPTGTYAGVMTFKKRVPLCCGPANAPVQCSPDETPVVACSDQPIGENQLALFTVVVPKTGLATGMAVIFNQGQVYTGTIHATADPDTAKVKGIISASFPYVKLLPDGSTTTVDGQASGQVTARARASTTTFTATSVRLTGTADIQFALTVNSPFDEIKFKISGFKQS
jgi:hypothetical protein